MQFGRKAKSIIEVGCASNPFIKYLNWIQKRTCVAPYFADYGNGLNKLEVGSIIEAVTADFMEYELPNNDKYDLLVCSQVVEHVQNPSAFVQKLIRSAKTSIISIPYKWEDCGSNCGHNTHEISYNRILEWSQPHVPIYSTIVQEASLARRIIVVYQPDQKQLGL